MEPNEETPIVEQPIDTPEAPVAETPPAEPVAPEDPFLKGVEEANAAEAAVTPQDPEVPAGDPEPTPEGDPKPEVPKVDDPKPEDEKPKDVETEIKELGITNERTQKRFRELTERASEVETYKTRAAKAEEWEQTIQSTGTNPEQFGAALNYLRAVNSGNPDAMSQAYDIMQKELQWLGEKLGKEAPGFDPLSKHADLQQQVANGDITKEVAAQLVAHRQRESLTSQHNQTQQQAFAAQQAQQTGIAQVQALGAQLQASDPQFQQKFAYLKPTLELIQSSLPPDRWAIEIQRAYAALPAIASAPATRPATPAPIRPSGAPVMQAKPKDEYEAFGMGVDLARARGA